MSDNELRPCPFCGATPVKLITGYMCSTLGCVLQENTISEKDWNTRPIEDELRNSIAELEAEIGQLTAHDATERQDDKWIPVSERLPEDGKPVWVCTIWNEQHSGFLIDGVWVGLFRDFREGEITHWMPLPVLPESPNDTQTQTIVYGKESEE